MYVELKVRTGEGLLTLATSGLLKMVHDVEQDSGMNIPVSAFNTVMVASTPKSQIERE